MLKIVLLVVLSVSVAWCQKLVLVDSEFHHEDVALFKQWMVKHQRSYASESEHEFRLTNFIANLQKINAHNGANLSWKMGLNQFSDMTFDEFQEKHLGVPQNCSATDGRTVFASSTPPKKDWRDGNFVTPVKNQKHCGSCWTFSTTGCLESVTAIYAEGNPLYSFSEQQLVDCAGAFDDHGCNGGLPSHAFEYVKYNKGLMTEHDYPYTGKDGNCNFEQSLAKGFVQDIVNITEGDENSLLNAVGNINPVSIAFQVTSDFMQYKSGIYSNPKCGKKPTDVNHAVLAVGYDVDSSNKPYWIIKNSWGTTFGIDGYFHMERGSNMCGLATCASYPIVP